MYLLILATAGATNLLLVTFLIPISALLLGVFVLGERLEWTLFLGMALIFAGLVGVDGRLLEFFSTRIRLHKAQQRTPGLAGRSFA
jgi:threonine/homoserine efflux transporter RhtA